MAVSSISRLTVPLANDQSSPTQGLLMPKLQYRFRVTLQNFGVATPTTELTKQVVSCSRPNVTFTPIEIPIYNSTVKLAGKYKWEDLSIVIRDDASGAVSALVGQQLQKQLDFYEQSSAASGINYKFLTSIEILDGGNGAYTPVVLEQWECVGCYVSGANYGELNYGNSEPCTITLTIPFDNAIQVPLGEGVGAPVGRTFGDVAIGLGST
jgi:hypothetical protein